MGQQMSHKNPDNQIPSPPAHDYDRQTDFTQFSINHPNTPIRGQDLDGEFNQIERAIDETQDRLDLIQRSDGALANHSVHPLALAPATLDLLTDAAVEASNEAADRAEAARDRAENAQTGAENAQAAAEQALADMSDNADRAEAARIGAEAAQGHAETAQGAAESAQSAAESAQTAAETAESRAADWADSDDLIDGTRRSAQYWAFRAENADSDVAEAVDRAIAAAAAAEGSAANAEGSATDAANSAQAAQTAQGGAETAQGAAEGAATAAAGSATGAADSATAAGASSDRAQEWAESENLIDGTGRSSKWWAATAENATADVTDALNQAQAAAAAASGSATDAADSAQSAQLAQAGAESAQTGAGLARDAAQTAQAGAESAQSAASNSATAASGSATAASNSAQAASNSATGAQTAEARAESAQTGAETARDRAQEWAEGDDWIDGTGRSAKYWAANSDAASRVPRTSLTGSAEIPAGTEAERDAVPLPGSFRFNTEAEEFEGFDGTEWGSIGGGDGFPAGTRMLFQQSTAPLGWTKDTDPELNDSALRVVVDAVGSGGSLNFTAAFASRAVAGTIGNTTATNVAAASGGTVGNSSLSTAQLASHNHGGAQRGAVNGGAGGAVHSASTATTTGNSGSGHAHGHGFTGSSHNHTQNAHGHTFTGTAINLAVKYRDVIIASRDAEE